VEGLGQARLAAEQSKLDAEKANQVRAAEAARVAAEGAKKLADKKPSEDQQNRGSAGRLPGRLMSVGI
jgi:hypothetical protein